jgi:phosphatidylglycerophosphate synthase
MGRVREAKAGAMVGPEHGRADSGDDGRAGRRLEAVVFATAPTPDGGSAALLPLAGTTPLVRLLDQLASLGMTAATVVTRPDWEKATREAVEGSTEGARVVASEDASSDLELISRLALGSSGELLVAPGHFVLHREALVGLLEDPRPASAILSGPLERSPWSFPFRSTRGRIASAGSLYHRVSRPTSYFLGVLKVAGPDRPKLAASAQELSSLTAAVPASWNEELERKKELWLERAVGPRPEPAGLPSDAQGLDFHCRVAVSDVIPLLFVGLVRSDVFVFYSSARKYFFTSPLSLEGAVLAEQELERWDEDRARLNAAVKKSDGFFTTFFVSPYSRYLARFAARRGWTPNAVTVTSFIVGLLAAASFAFGTRAGLVVGAVLLQASFTIDCVDGQLARYTRHFSKLGAWLDSVFDRTKEYIVYAGLAVGSIRGFDDDVWVLAAAALTLQTVRHVSDFSFMARQVVRVVATQHAPLEEAKDSNWIEPLVPSKRPTELPLRQRLGYLAAETVRRLRRARTTRWAARIAAFPIGERFALISVTAAIFSPRVTFVAFLVWGGVSLTYAFVRRLMASYQVPGRVARVVFR